MRYVATKPTFIVLMKANGLQYCLPELVKQHSNSNTDHYFHSPLLPYFSLLLPYSVFLHVIPYTDKTVNLEALLLKLYMVEPYVQGFGLHGVPYVKNTESDPQAVKITSFYDFKNLKTSFEDICKQQSSEI